MSTSPYTLGHFLSLERSGVETHLRRSDAGTSAGIRRLEQTLAEKARGLPFAAVSSAMADRIADLLQIDVAALLPGAWKKSTMIFNLLVKSAKSPGETYLTQLAKHTLRSVHHPRLEIYVEGHLVHRLMLEVTLELVIEGAVLEIEGGGIREARLATVKGKGAIALEGLTIVERETKTFELPGRIRFADDPEPAAPEPPMPAAEPEGASLSGLALR